jgi:predicted transcriptional regulator
MIEGRKPGRCHHEYEKSEKFVGMVANLKEWTCKKCLKTVNTRDIQGIEQLIRENECLSLEPLAELAGLSQSILDRKLKVLMINQRIRRHKVRETKRYVYFIA